MPPSTALVSDMRLRGQFVCRSCLVSLRAGAARSPARPQWPATTATTTARTTSTVLVRTAATTATQNRTRRAASASRRNMRRPDDKTTAHPATATRPSQPPIHKAQVVKQGDNDHMHNDEEDFTVRFFEQGYDGNIRELRQDGTDDFENEDIDREIERELNDLESKLENALKLVEQREKNTPATKKADRLRRRYELMKQVEREADEEDEEALVEAGQKATPNVKISYEKLQANPRRHVHNLNRTLTPAFRRLRQNNGWGDEHGKGGVDDKIVSALWRRYGLARTALAENWENVPVPVWKCLWTVLGWSDPNGRTKNPNRMSHIMYLAKDMQAANFPLTNSQQLLVMEAMFVEGWETQALDNWKRGTTTLGTQPETATQYWELGLKMWALHGDLERAERVADHLFGEFKEDEGYRPPQETAMVSSVTKIGGRPADPRALYVLIRAAASQDVKDKAWMAYRRMRAVMERRWPGKGMQLEDYDEVVSSFLSAKQTEYAFDVFVDMMFSGAVNAHGRENSSQARRLPPAVANLFFFGKWLKRLIGAGDLDGAHRVLLFMQHYKVMTAAVQVNGLLGAWLRSGTGKAQAKADVLAWSMIDSRRLFVDLRRREATLDWPLRLHRVRQKNPGKDVNGDEALTFVPRASLETFSLMADNYKKRGQAARMEQLWAAYKECEMSTATADAFMMNHLLDSYANENRPAEARALYKRMVHGPHQVVPNTRTFLSVFRTLEVHRRLEVTNGGEPALSDSQRRADAKTARGLLADMASLSWVFQPGADQADAPEVVQALGRLVAHTFRKTGDYVGLAVVLRVLGPVLGGRFVMTDTLAVELVAESASDLSRVTITAPASPALQRRIFRAGEVVEALLRERRAKVVAAAAAAGKAGSVKPGTAADLSADLAAVVTQFYRHKTGLSDAAFDEMYAAAAAELGVAGML